MAMHKALHPRDDVDGLYVLRKAGGRGVTSIEDSVDTSIQLENYTEKNEGGLITATRNNTDNTKANRMSITRKQKCEKTTLWAFKTTNKQYLTRENVDVAKKRKH